MSLAIHYTDAQARRAVYWVVAIDCAFALAYIVIHIWQPELPWGPLRPLFDLDREISLPTWFSVVKLFAVSAVLFLAALNNRQKEYLSTFPLMVAGLIFVWLSADEGAQIHENITYMARHFGQEWMLFSGEYGAWMIVYAALGLLGMALGVKHLIALWRHYNFVAQVGLTGAAIFVIGAVGFEIASFPLRESEATLTLKLITVVFEEFFELFGITVILYATLILAKRLSTSRDVKPVA